MKFSHLPETSKETDRESGLDYYPARFRDASLGYWISPDNARQFPNLYGYGTNRLNSVDLDGKWVLCFDNSQNLIDSYNDGRELYDVYEISREDYFNPDIIKGGTLVSDDIEWFDAYTYGVGMTRGEIDQANKYLGSTGWLLSAFPVTAPVGAALLGTSMCLDGSLISTKLMEGEKLDWHDGAAMSGAITFGVGSTVSKLGNLTKVQEQILGSSKMLPDGAEKGTDLYEF